MNDVVNRPKKVACFHHIIALLLVAVVAGGCAGESRRQNTAQDEVPVRARDYIDDYAQLNALREGVVCLDSGVQYEVLQTGKGQQPLPGDTVSVHYRAMLANGVEFDNTHERGQPATLNLGEYVVPGLREALLLMKEGDEWRVTIPAKLGFSGGRLLRKRDLIYEVTLLAIVATTPSIEDQPHSPDGPDEGS